MSTLDPNTAAVLSAMADSGQPALESLEPETARAAITAGLSALQGEPVPVADVASRQAMGNAGEIPLRVYRPPSKDGTAPPAIVFFHGGGFVLGDLDMYDRACRQLCAASQCAVISVDYRLAPEHPFPAAVDDAIAATRWVSTQAEDLGIRAGGLCVAGDSAGANLATVVAHQLAADPSVHIAHQLLLYPVTDFSRESAGYTERGEGYFLTAPLMRYFRTHYIGESADKKDPRLSPLLIEDLSAMPPATLLLCGFDPLLEEGAAYGHALQEAGVSVDTVHLEDQIHGFLLMDGAIPAAAATLNDLGARVGMRLAKALDTSH